MHCLPSFQKIVNTFNDFIMIHKLVHKTEVNKMEYRIGDKVQLRTSGEITGIVLEYKSIYRYSLDSDVDEYRHKYHIRWSDGSQDWVDEDEIKPDGISNNGITDDKIEVEWIGSTSDFIIEQIEEAIKEVKDTEAVLFNKGDDNTPIFEENINKDTQIFLLDILINGSLDMENKEDFLHYAKLKKQLVSGDKK